MQNQYSEQSTQEEFNRWAEAGRGDHMEEEHLPIVLPVLKLAQFQPDDSVLDVGCGTGWLARRLAARVPQGRVVGMDIANEMVRLAQQSSGGINNLQFIKGTVASIPLPSSEFTQAISVESAYYWSDPAQGLKEIFRVLKPSGRLWVLINYYRDNPYCHQWGQLLPIPTHLLSAGEWASLFRNAGFAAVSHRRIPDPSPSPEVYIGRWFRDAGELRAFKREGALLLSGVRPAAAF
jgi:arsenite methyltransferase